MYKKTTLNAAIQTILTASALVSLLPAANANEEKAPKAADEKIVITGTRILREGAIAPSPVTVISGDTLRSSGALTLGEALNDLPSLASTFSLASAGNSIGTSGLNLLDLRGMGTSRTLVLVDGKRHVASSPGSAAVDINTIPAIWVERVEIITGGASAVYGADAVTGVVNFILKDNIEGLDISASQGYAQEGPYDNQTINFSFGNSFAEGKGNFGVSIGYTGQDGMTAKDKAQTRIPSMSVTNPADNEFDDDGKFVGHDGIPDNIIVPNAGWFDDSVAGNFYTYDPDNGVEWFIFNPDGSVREQRLGTTYDNWGRCSGDCDILDLTRYSELQPTFEAFNVTSKAHYDLNDQVRLYADLKYAETESDSIGQPSFFEYGRAFSIQRDNPYIHESLAALMDAKGLDSINLHRFMEDAGRRKEINTRETSQFAVGLDGFTDDWDYQAYLQYGQTEATQINFANTIVDRLYQSADAIRDENGNIVCRDEAARAAGCVPTSLFGEGAVDPAAAAWFNTTSTSTSKIQQTVFNASMTNSSLLSLPAGDLGVAVGAEYRKERSDSIPDAFAATGATFLNALQEEHGKFNVKEVFAELSAPLLADLPGVQSLSLDAALRYADYSSVGEETSWKLGLDWSIYDDLRFRATKSEAIRAPNITELYGPLNQNFFSVYDPCEASRVQDPVRAENCAALGIPADFKPTATASSVPGVSGGNADLNPETSDSYTLGLVFTPAELRGFSATIDYWNIDIANAIAPVSAQNILDKCVDSPSGIDNQYCALITRDADNELVNIRSVIQNISRLDARGIDFDVAYDFEMLAGNMSTRLVATRLVSRRTFAFQDEPGEFTQGAGTVGEAQWQANLILGYSKDAWTGSLRTRYLQSVDLFDADSLARNPDPSNILAYDDYFQTDIRAAYQFDNGVSIDVGIDNMFDAALPPFSNGTGASSASYDNIGRFYYTMLSYSL